MAGTHRITHKRIAHKRIADRRLANQRVAGRRATRRILAITLLLLVGAAAGASSSSLIASGGQTSGADTSVSDYDSQAERVLLDLANQARAQAGAPALKLDVGLRQAARAHAERMSAMRQLSHQFDGESSLSQRLGNATRIPLDEEGENVALDSDAGKAHQHLMLSPPHRANLLNPSFNVAGMGVVRSGDRVYVVQDFGHALPNYSVAEAKDQIAAAVAQARHHAKLPELPRRDLSKADDAACSMAKADKLGTSAVQQLAQHYAVLTYTTLQPETPPANLVQVISGPNLRSFSIGACYARTATYPTGAYWVVLSLD